MDIFIYLCTPTTSCLGGGCLKKYLTDFEWILNKASLLMACTASKWNKIKQIHENASSSK